MREYAELANSLNVRHSYSMFMASPNHPMFQDFIFNEDDLSQVAKNISAQNQSAPFQDVPISQTGLSCRNGCEAGNKLVSIAANGDIFPCHMLQTPEMRLGNLADMESSLQKAVFSESNPFQNLNYSMINECKDCKYKELCGAGCRGRSFLYHKDIVSQDAYCGFIKTFYINTFNGIKSKLSVEK